MVTDCCEASGTQGLATCSSNADLGVWWPWRVARCSRYESICIHWIDPLVVQASGRCISLSMILQWYLLTTYSRFYFKSGVLEGSLLWDWFFLSATWEGSTGSHNRLLRPFVVIIFDPLTQCGCNVPRPVGVSKIPSIFWVTQNHATLSTQYLPAACALLILVTNLRRSCAAFLLSPICMISIL